MDLKLRLRSNAILAYWKSDKGAVMPPGQNTENVRFRTFRIGKRKHK